MSDESGKQIPEEKSNHDEEDSFVAPGFFLDRQLSLTGALDENREYVATANEKSITEIARILLEVGNSLQDDYRTKWKKHQTSTNSLDQEMGKLNSALRTVDVVLEYLEFIGSKMLEDVKTHEAVLRGILQFSGLAFQMEIFTFLKLFVKCIAVPEDPYLADRNHIIESLECVKSQEIEINQLMEKGGAILLDIVRGETFANGKAREFDDIMRKANMTINSCRKRLESIGPVIENLMSKAYTIKWFFRGVRLCGMGITWCYIYGKYKDSSISWPTALAGGMLTGAAWLTLFPFRSYQLFDSLKNLKYMSDRLDTKLEELHRRMLSDTKQKNKIVAGNNG